MKRIELPLNCLIVVDARSEDYDVFVSQFDDDGVRIRLFSSGEEALRASNGGGSTLWIINVRLPDMPGVGLLKLVRRRMGRSSVFLVGDEYSAIDELAARSVGATAYFCKPPSAAWLEGFRLSDRAPAILGPTLPAFEAAAAMRPP